MQRKAIMPEPAGIFGLVLFLILACSSGARLLGDADTFWHIKIGRTIIETGKILTQDIFSHTAFGTPWIAHEWLTEVCMAFVTDTFGLAGLSLCAFLLVALTFTLLYRLNSDVSNDWVALASMTLTIPLAHSHLLARPHVLSWLFGVSTLYLLHRGGRWLLGLPLVIMVWANFHGSVLMGLAFQGIFWFGTLLDHWPGRSGTAWESWWQRSRNQFYVLALSTILVGANPFGYQLLWFPFHVSKEIFAREIHEWMAPNLQVMWYVRAWALLMLLFAARYWRKTPWAWRIMVLLLIYQALGHARHISIAALYLSPWVAMVLNDLAKETRWPWRRTPVPGEDLPTSPVTGPCLTIAACALFLVVLASAPGLRHGVERSLFPMPDSYSQDVVDYLERGVPQGNLLNDYRWGGYLLYAMRNPPKVFIDGRADMYGEHVFGDYVALSKLDPEFDRLMRQYDIDWVLFPRDHLVVRHLLQSGGWRVVYENRDVRILIRETSA